MIVKIPTSGTRLAYYESTVTMRIDWDMVDPAKGLHAGWGVMSSEDSEEIAALDIYLYVLISSRIVDHVPCINLHTSSGSVVDRRV